MELSELVRFNGNLYAFDDRTGIVFEVRKDDTAVARHVVTEGDGTSTKGMKMEWATVKDGKIWIGSVGKEYTSQDGSTILNGNPFWVVSLDSSGQVEHHDWEANYTAMRKALKAAFPGYLIHEAINWSSVMRKWVVLPRRVSQQPYDDILDEDRGSNKMLICDENFEDIQIVEVGVVHPRRGFSSFKFVPGTNEEVLVALKSEEDAKAETQLTYITVFTIKGQVLFPDTLVPSSHKFEGIEFDDF